MPATKEQTDEHPIIFSGWSINRILAGEKSETRRIVKPQPPSDVRSVMWDDMGGDWIGTVGSRNDPIRWNEKCPYGQPGDVLWVREAFRLPECYDHLSPREYVDDTCLHAVQYEAYQPYDKQYGGYRWGRKRPSIHMPRELCRLRLRVEGVRVERLQEIDGDDAAAEGISTDYHIIKRQRRFARKWNDIHGTGAWEENPHVWVVEFSKIDSE
jgi:hypothetical protein